MWNEHFGICIVEYMASGLIVVAHDSAGPKNDIIIPVYPRDELKYALNNDSEKATGFLAASIEEYVSALEFIFSHEKDLHYIRQNARDRARNFSTEKFVTLFKEKVKSLFCFVCSNKPATV